VLLAAFLFTIISDAILVMTSHFSLTCSTDAQKDRTVLAYAEFLHPLRIYCNRATKTSPEAEDNTKGGIVADFCSP